MAWKYSWGKMKKKLTGISLHHRAMMCHSRITNFFPNVRFLSRENIVQGKRDSTFNEYLVMIRYSDDRKNTFEIVIYDMRGLNKRLFILSVSNKVS